MSKTRSIEGILPFLLAILMLLPGAAHARELRIVYGNDNLGEIAERQKRLVEGLRAMLGLTAKVTLVAPKSIVRSEGKAVRVIDKRKI